MCACVCVCVCVCADGEIAKVFVRGLKEVVGALDITAGAAGVFTNVEIGGLPAAPLQVTHAHAACRHAPGQPGTDTHTHTHTQFIVRMHAFLSLCDVQLDHAMHRANQNPACQIMSSAFLSEVHILIFPFTAVLCGILFTLCCPLPRGRRSSATCC